MTAKRGGHLRGIFMSLVCGDFSCRRLGPRCSRTHTRTHTPPNKNHHNKDFTCQAGGPRLRERGSLCILELRGVREPSAQTVREAGGVAWPLGNPDTPQSDPLLTPALRAPAFNQDSHSKINNPFLHVCPLRPLLARPSKGLVLQTRISVHRGNRPAREFPLCLIRSAALSDLLPSWDSTGGGAVGATQKQQGAPWRLALTYLSGFTLPPIPGPNSLLSS